MIAYTYEVVSVNLDGRSMEIAYASPGRSPIHVGARLPYIGETLDQVAAMYSPARFWEEQDTAVQIPTVGAAGSFTPPGVEVSTLGTEKQRKRIAIAAARYVFETSGVLVGGATIATDRESQAQLTSAFSSLSGGLIQSIDWKTSNGAFATLGLPEVTAIAAAVAGHVQSSFTQEKGLVALVDAATSIEEVQAIALPWPNSNIVQGTVNV